MAPPSCLEEPRPGYRPNKTERCNHIMFQFLALFFSYMTCAWIEGYDGVDPLPVGVVGAAFMMIVIAMLLYLFNVLYTLEWWRQTYVISFLCTGLWTIFFTSVIFTEEKKKGNVSNKDKGVYIMYASLISLGLIVLEYILVIHCKQFWIAKYYRLGYISTTKLPALQEYLGTTSTLLVVDDTMSNAPYIYAYERQSPHTTTYVQQPSPPRVVYETNNHKTTIGGNTETDPLSSTLTSV